MNVHFVIAFALPLLVCFVLDVVLLAQRIKQAYLPPDDDAALVRTASGTSAQSQLSETRDCEGTAQEGAHAFAHLEKPHTSAIAPDHAQSSRTAAGAQRKRNGGAKLVKQSKSLWDIHIKVNDHRLASSVMLVTSLVFLLWLPYVIVAYMYTFHGSELSQWEGFYTIAMLFANLSFCVKPLALVTHNKELRRDVRDVFSPKVVRKYHEYNDKRREAVAVVKDKMAAVAPARLARKTNSRVAHSTEDLPRVASVSPKLADVTARDDGVVRPKTGQRKRRRKRSGASGSDSGGTVTSRTMVEELEMSDFRESSWPRDDDFDSVGDEDTWMRVVEEGSIPRTPRSQ